MSNIIPHPTPSLAEYLPRDLLQPKTKPTDRVFYVSRGGVTVDVGEPQPDGRIPVKFMGEERLMTPADFEAQFERLKESPGPVSVVLPPPIGMVSGALPVALTSSNAHGLAYELVEWAKAHPGQRVISPQVVADGDEWACFFWTCLVVEKDHMADVAEVTAACKDEIQKRQADRRAKQQDALAEAKKLEAEEKERHEGEIQQLRKDAEQGKKCRENHGKKAKK